MGEEIKTWAQHAVFKPMPKIARLYRDIIITEKIDGTNASIYIDCHNGIRAASRNRWLDPGQSDNMGFAAWVAANKEELLKLGEGHHFGEWWGSKIGRGYGLKERRFSLFNTTRWKDAATRPSCVGVVPILYEGPFWERMIYQWLENLRAEGSFAAPGFMRPEGLVIYHTHSNQLFKVTLDGDQHKGETK